MFSSLLVAGQGPVVLPPLLVLKVVSQTTSRVLQPVALVISTYLFIHPLYCFRDIRTMFSICYGYLLCVVYIFPSSCTSE